MKVCIIYNNCMLNVFRRYVQRAFSSVNDNKDKDEVEKLLRAKLTEAFNSGRVNTMDWDTEPLPGYVSQFPTVL